MKHRYWLFAVAALAACGGDDDGAAVDASPPSIDALSTSRCTSMGGPGGTHKLYLNFESQDLTPGPNDSTMNTSSIITAPGTSPPWFDGNANRDASIALITDGVTAVLAPFDVEVVTTRPAAGPYAMAVMGGDPTDLGLPTGIGGITAVVGCTGIENAIHLIFNQQVNPAITSVVASFGIGLGIPSSDVHNDCMCWSGPNCSAATELCTIGEDVAIDPNIGSACGVSGTYDEHLMFKQALGCRP